MDMGANIGTIMGKNRVGTGVQTRVQTGVHTWGTNRGTNRGARGRDRDFVRFKILQVETFWYTYSLYSLYSLT